MPILDSTRRLATIAILFAAAGCRPAPAPSTTPAPAPKPTGPIKLILPPPTGAMGMHAIVPAPSQVIPAEGAPFTMKATGAIVVSPGNADAARVAEMLSKLVRVPTSYRYPVAQADSQVAAGGIALRLGGDATLGSEGYELLVTTDSVRITAPTAAGLFHGMQSLRQLMPAGIEAQQGAMKLADAWTVPLGRIVDRPRFTWRGAMLDVSRHFFTVDEVKQYVDLLALYKMNTMHLHLSDDQGWRIQIDSRPKLTEIGGSSEVGGGRGGYYTKADYAEIVRYAQDRFITVVPEIDMPGHTNAAIASYPELGCSKPTPGLYGGTQPLGVYTGISVGWSTFCPDKEETYAFVSDVVRELAAMTPGPYIHIGGDEVAALSNAQYAAFVERVQDIVYQNGKTPIGWEEIGKAKLRPTTIAQMWRSDTALLASRQGAKLVMSPGPRAYLDMKPTPAVELGLRWAGMVELRNAYDWDPETYFSGVPAGAVLGVESPLWSETVQNITAAMYLLVPRLPAIAEVGWSDPAVRNWESFRTRIANHAPRWRLLGINYYPSPQVDWK